MVVVLTALIFSYNASSGIFIGTLINNYITLDHVQIYRLLGLSVIPALSGALSVYIASQTNRNIRDFFGSAPTGSEIDGLDVFYFCLLYACLNTAALLIFNALDQQAQSSDMLSGILAGLFGQLSGSFMGFVEDSNPYECFMPDLLHSIDDQRKRALTGSLLVLCAGLSWSFSGLLVRSAPNLDSWQFLTYRSLGLALAFAVLDHINKRPSLLPRLIGLGWPGWLASVLMAGAFITYIFALMNTTVANALFISSLAPILSAIIGFFVLGERLNRGMGIAVIIGVAGLAVMVNGAIGGGNMFGNLMALCPPLCFASYSVLLRLRPKQNFSAIVNGFALLVILVAFPMMILNGSDIFPPLKEAGAAFANGFVTMGLGFYLFQRGAPRIPAVSQTLLAQTETLAGPIWVWLLLNERPSLNTLMGGSIILFAVVLMAYYGAKHEAELAPEWVDYNGHMNDAAYALVFSRSFDAFMDELGMDADFRARTKLTIYTLTMLIHYRQEAKLGQKLDIGLHLLDFDAKKLHIWLEMRCNSNVIAMSEQLLVCVDQSGEAPKSTAFPAEVATKIEALALAQKDLPRPKEAGRGIAIKR
eukprot:gene9528-9604_t